MKMRAALYFAFALLLGLGTAYGARLWIAGERAQPQPPITIAKRPTVSVLVAAADLSTGSFVHPADLRWQTWPDDQVSDFYLRTSDDSADAGKEMLQSLVGGVVRFRMAAGDPVTTNRIIKPGERGFLAAVLTIGMRAVSVPVTATSGVAGFVFPGDRVDLILSHIVKDETNPNAPGKLVTETVLTGIRVLAVDQATADQENKPMLAKTMTFEVTPKQVEVIGVMSALGTLSLSLRSLERQDEASGESQGDRTLAISHTLDSEVSPLIQHHQPVKNHAAPVGVTVLRGSGSSAAHIVSAVATPTAAGGAQ